MNFEKIFNESRERRAKTFQTPSGLDCAKWLCNFLKDTNFKLRVRGGGTSEYDSVDLDQNLIQQYYDERGEIDSVQICRGNQIYYKIYFPSDIHQGYDPIEICRYNDNLKLDNFKSYDENEFMQDIKDAIHDIQHL